MYDLDCTIMAFELSYTLMNEYTVKRLQKIILFDRLRMWDYDMID